LLVPQNGWKGKKEGVSSYRMTLRKSEDIGTLRRKNQTRLCGKYTFQGVMDISKDTRN
jgi:hypothetical protein